MDQINQENVGVGLDRGNEYTKDGFEPANPIRDSGELHPRPRRLLILACSATKRHDPDPISARERYDGCMER
jgi:hypothetical protein